MSIRAVLSSRSVRALFVAASFAAEATAQLQPPQAPPENPLRPEKILLGKVLFWDEQLSSDNTMACGTCHQPGQGGADPNFTRTAGPDGVIMTADDVWGSPGVIRADHYGHYDPSNVFGLGRQVTGRLAQTYITASYFTTNFWDGRAASKFIDPQTGAVSIVAGGALESQLVNPPFATVEMADQGRTWTELLNKLAKVKPLALATRLPIDLVIGLQNFPTYADLFRHAFGDPTMNSERVAFAIASYERSLVPDDTPWDQYVSGNPLALNSDQLKGLALFNGKARCNLCHIAPLFADDSFHNIGLRPPAEDLGLQNTTGQRTDRGRFKTPSLRNAGLRRRWMHNGEFGDINQVIDLYIRGGDFSDNLDPLIVPLNINNNEKFSIYNFVTSGLRDHRVEAEMAPFDRPTLHSEIAANPSLYGGESAGSGGVAPKMIAVTPPVLGAESFRLGISDALGGAAAWLAIATDPAASGSNWYGVPLNVAITPLPYLIGVTLSGAGSGAGFGTVAFTLPSSPALAGQDWYAQWFVADAAAVGGLSATQGARFEFFTR